MALMDFLNTAMQKPEFGQLAGQLMEMGQPKPMMVPDGKGGLIPNPDLQKNNINMSGVLGMMKGLGKTPEADNYNPFPRNDVSTPAASNTPTYGTGQLPLPQQGYTPVPQQQQQPPRFGSNFMQSVSPFQGASTALPSLNQAANGTAPMSPPMMTNNNGIIDRLMGAIGTQESSNRYDILGPKTKYGQPIGKYQILPTNIPQWSKQALGYEVTPEQFRNSPQIQDAVARAKMTEYLNKYKTPEDVRSVWFSGKPLAGNNRRDPVLNLSVPDDNARFRKLYYSMR